MSKIYLSDDQMWAGSTQSFDAYSEAMARMEAASPAELKAFADMEDDDDLPFHLKVQGNIGILSVKGPLSNSDSPYAKYYGIPTYPDIREAALHAAKDERIEAIFLDIASGGGAVAGLADTANLISMIDQKIKPVYTFSDGPMASAAYWLGVSGREVHAGATAVVGSIGVLTTHMEYSKQLKADGVGATVIRSGKYKALVNSIEPLSEEGKAQIQAHVDAVDAVFISYVADRRGTTVERARSTMGEGREFVGQAALGAGLIDSVTTFDAVFSKIAATLAPKSGMPLSHNRTHSPTMKQALTETQIAALAAGAPLDATAASTDQPAATTAAAEAGAPEAGVPAEATPAAAAPASVEPPKAAAATPVAAAQAESAVVDFLRGELRAAQAELVASKLEATKAADALAAIQATQASLMKIAAQSLSTMRVALGGVALTAEMSAEALLAEHATAQATFAEKFKAGGVAAVKPAAASQAAAQPVQSAASAARIQATRLS